jgi:hypothetical protein
MNNRGYSHRSAGYTDSVSKDVVRTRTETRNDKQAGLRGVKRGLSHAEPMRREFEDPNGLDYLGGIAGKR